VKRRFVVADNAMSDEQEKQFIAWLRDEVRVGWWHYLKGFWLIADRYERISATAIRDKLKMIKSPLGAILVMEIHDDITWAGVHLPGRTDTFDWLPRQWTGENGD